ncbi:MAG: hypothetical protein JJU41_08850 [Bacteroidetes bacterium]|nr:hypothetical protein [Bacteroidota bacterium]
MGQQQLLLVILVTIIVGIATVVAINTFSSAAESANLDALRNDVASIAASAQAYYIRPAMLGGGGNSFVGITFQNITFSGNIAQGTNNLTAVNANGAYVIQAGATATSFTVRAYPASGVTTTVDENDATLVTTTISGPFLEADILANDIEWQSVNLTTAGS